MVKRFWIWGSKVHESVWMTSSDYVIKNWFLKKWCSPDRLNSKWPSFSLRRRCRRMLRSTERVPQSVLQRDELTASVNTSKRVLWAHLDGHHLIGLEAHVDGHLGSFRRWSSLSFVLSAVTMKHYFFVSHFTCIFTFVKHTFLFGELISEPSSRVCARGIVVSERSANAPG